MKNASGPIGQGTCSNDLPVISQGTCTGCGQPVGTVDGRWSCTGCGAYGG